MEYFVEVYLYIAERTKDGLDNPKRFYSRSSRSTAKNSPITHRASKLDAQRAFNTPSYIYMKTSNKIQDLEHRFVRISHVLRRLLQLNPDFVIGGTDVDALDGGRHKEDPISDLHGRSKSSKEREGEVERGALVEK